MSRDLITIKSSAERERVIKIVRDCEWRTRVMFLEPARSLEQNDRLWLMLSCVSKQLLWHGKKWPSEAWKDYFCHALSGEQWMPYEDGGMIPIGRSTSKLSVSEFADLMELIEAFAARHSVCFPWTEVSQEKIA